MRAASILAVVFGHSFGLFEAVGHLPILGKVSPELSEHILNFGVFGVELFFVLSGFLIGGILIRTFVQANEFTFSDVRNFWIRRWFRTIPNYWLVLTTSFVVFQYMKFDPFQLPYLKGYVFMQNLRHPNILNSFPEGWSLAVEEWFYLTLPVVMYLCAKVFRPVNKPHFLFKVFLGYLLVFLLIRFFNAFNPLNGRDPDEGIRKVVFFRLDAVMYGVLFAWLNYFRPMVVEKIRLKLLFTGVLLFSVLFYLCMHYRLVFIVQADPVIRFLNNAFLYFLVPLSFSFLLPYFNSIKTSGNHLTAAVVQHISKISYSVYLLHFSIVYRPFFMTLHPASFKSAVLYYLLYWVVVFGLASVVYRFFEYPVMALRDRFTPRNM